MFTTHITVRDPQQSLQAMIEEDLAHAIIGSLSADPETITELQAALTRFVHPQRASGLFASWERAAEPSDDSLQSCIIDLSARMVVTSWEHELEDGLAATPYVEVQGSSERWFAYHLSESWRLTSDLQHWQTLAQSRAEQRLRQPRVDLRQVLYGDPLLEFLVAATMAAARASERSPSCADLAEVRSGRYRADNPAYRLAREIHARWLTMPQPRLQGRSLRDHLLADRIHIARDIEHRAQQWVSQGHCPPGLSETDAAYRWGGLGTHEIILYYDLVRYLLYCVLDPYAQQVSVDCETELQRLRDLRDDWLSQPQPDSAGSTPPRDVIDRERRRLPLVDNDASEFDCDCPLCRMMSQPGAGPAFTYLGGFHLDDDFAFSFCQTREEWDSQAGDGDNLDLASAPSLLPSVATDFDPDECDDDDRGAELARCAIRRTTPSVWKTSYVSPDIRAESPATRLFGVGTYLAELIADLKQPDGSRTLIDGLNRQYDNLCQSVRPSHRGLTQPVLDRFCEQLQEVADKRPDLTAKCNDLQEHLREWFPAEDASE